MKFTPGKNAVMIIEMTKKDLECYTNLVDKAFLDFIYMEASLLCCSVYVCMYVQWLHL